MDLFTNFILSSLGSLIVLVAGLLFIRSQNADPTMAYISWIKMWAIFIDWSSALLFSLLLSSLFPDPTDGNFNGIMHTVTGLMVSFWH